ncbi:MAG: hypothetical protein ACKO96_14025, partial [Flammeovirgaceae bacterium]
MRANGSWIHCRHDYNVTFRLSIDKNNPTYEIPSEKAESCRVVLPEGFGYATSLAVCRPDTFLMTEIRNNHSVVPLSNFFQFRARDQERARA